MTEQGPTPEQLPPPNNSLGELTQALQRYLEKNNLPLYALNLPEFRNEALKELNPQPPLQAQPHPVENADFPMMAVSRLQATAIGLAFDVQSPAEIAIARIPWYADIKVPGDNNQFRSVTVELVPANVQMPDEKVVIDKDTFFRLKLDENPDGTPLQILRVFQKPEDVNWNALSRARRNR